MFSRLSTLLVIVLTAVFCPMAVAGYVKRDPQVIILREAEWISFGDPKGAYASFIFYREFQPGPGGRWGQVAQIRITLKKNKKEMALTLFLKNGAVNGTEILVREGDVTTLLRSDHPAVGYFSVERVESYKSKGFPGVTPTYTRGYPDFEKIDHFLSLPIGEYQE